MVNELGITAKFLIRCQLISYFSDCTKWYEGLKLESPFNLELLMSPSLPQHPLNESWSPSLV